MVANSFRYYAGQYWIYVDFFVMAALAFLMFELVERFRSIPMQVGTVTLLGLLYFTQFQFVAKNYPQYNFDLRDRIDQAGHGIYRVSDYADLMKQKYGDTPDFVQRVLSDPLVNGSDRGIDLRSKPGVRG